MKKLKMAEKVKISGKKIRLRDKKVKMIPRISLLGKKETPDDGLPE